MTDEQPIGQATPIRAGLVGSLLAIAFVAGSAHWRLASAESKIEEVKQSATKERDKADTQRDELVELKADVRHIKDTLDKIDRKLSRGTRSAGGMGE